MTTRATPAITGVAGKALPGWIESVVWALAGGLHLLFWVSLRTGWLSPLFNDTTHLFGPGCDFFALYQAGYSARHGWSLYTYPHAHVIVPYVYPFRYLPIAAYLAGVPLSYLPPTLAYSAWLGINELCLLHNVRLTYTRSGGGVRGAALGALWLCFAPLFVHMWLGQFTLLLACMLFWSVLALESGRTGKALGWWIASFLWKPASLLWLPIWARRRECWLGLAIAGALLLANGLYFSAYPRDWGVFADANLRLLSLWVTSNIGLSALLYEFTGPTGWFTALRVGVDLALVAPALWLTFRPLQGLGKRTAPQLSRRETETAWLVAAVWTTLFFLIYKEVWEQHLVLILPFLVLGVWRAPSRVLLLLTAWLALPSPFVFYDVPGLPVNGDPQLYFSPAVLLLHHAWRAVPLLLLYLHWLRMLNQKDTKTGQN